MRLVPNAGAALEERLGDLLYQADLPWCAPLALPKHAEQKNVEVARVEVRFRDASGQEKVLSAPLLADYVGASEIDQELDAAVLRARDERLLSDAQTSAEAHAQRGDYRGAQAVLGKALARMAVPELVAFAKDVLLPSYEHQASYARAAALRASTDKALKKRRMLGADRAVYEHIAMPASKAELDMEESFRKPGQPKR